MSSPNFSLSLVTEGLNTTNFSGPAFCEGGASFLFLSALLSMQLATHSRELGQLGVNMLAYKATK